MSHSSFLLAAGQKNSKLNLRIHVPAHNTIFTLEVTSPEVKGRPIYTMGCELEDPQRILEGKTSLTNVNGVARPLTVQREDRFIVFHLAENKPHYAEERFVILYTDLLRRVREALVQALLEQSEETVPESFTTADCIRTLREIFRRRNSLHTRPLLRKVT